MLALDLGFIFGIYCSTLPTSASLWASPTSSLILHTPDPLPRGAWKEGRGIATPSWGYFKDTSLESSSRGIFHALPKELSHAGGGIWDLGFAHLGAVAGRNSHQSLRSAPGWWDVLAFGEWWIEIFSYLLVSRDLLEKTPLGFPEANLGLAAAQMSASNNRLRWAPRSESKGGREKEEEREGKKQSRKSLEMTSAPRDNIKREEL